MGVTSDYECNDRDWSEKLGRSIAPEVKLRQHDEVGHQW